MSLDLVEFALSRMTDFAGFEKLACDVLYVEGYTRLETLGGNADRGRDAVQESHYSDGEERIVFQITTDKDITGKVSDTIAKLRTNKVAFTELVMVTSYPIGSERIDSMKEAARRKHRVTLQVFAQRRLVTVLANFSNGIFYRHFPDIQKQVSEFTSSKPTLPGRESQTIETAMLRSAIVFALSPESRTARRSLLDRLVIAAVSQAGATGLSLEQIKKTLDAQVRRSLDSGALSAATFRLCSAGSLSEREGVFGLANSASLALAVGAVKVGNQTTEFIDDIVERVCGLAPARVSKELRSTLERNALDGLVAFFRLHGTEVCGDPQNAIASRSHLDGQKMLVGPVERDLPVEIGKLLTATLGDALRNPTPEHGIVLTNWSRAHIAIQVMNLDPALGELQAGRLAQKHFALDTDYVLDCLVHVHKPAEAYLKLLETLIKTGCTVTIPPACIAECANHARIAKRTYDYFGPSLLSLSPEIVEEEVQNVFVKGYYYGRTRGLVASSDQFEKYLANFYDRDDPSGFLKESLVEILPHGVKVNEPVQSSTTAIPSDMRLKLTSIFHTLISGSTKGQRRTDNENMELAKTDADLFLCTYHANEPRPDNKTRILPGSHYLVTASTRYAQAAMKLGLTERVTTSPQSLLGLLDVVGLTTVSPGELSALYINPLLANAVSEIWPDAEALARAGVELSGQSLPRLRRVFDQKLHAMLTRAAESDAPVSPEDDELHGEAEAQNYIAILDAAKDRGLRLIPPAQTLKDTIDRGRMEAHESIAQVAQFKQALDKMEELIGQFGARRQRYLRRMLRIAKEKKDT